MDKSHDKQTTEPFDVVVGTESRSWTCARLTMITVVMFTMSDHLVMF